jgi:tetratricopeptide (TPR) repeat protein
MGQPFTFEELLAMAERPERELEQALDEAERVGLVRALDRDRYGFDHALTQGTLYGELTTFRRRRLHAAAAQAIEGLPERKRKGRDAELARHLLGADEPEQALPYTLLAGDAASAVHAYADAERQYRIALELAREIESELTVEALEKLGGVLTTLGRYQEAETLLEEATRLYRQVRAVDGEARVVARLGYGHMARGTLAQGVTRLRRFLDSLEEGGSASPDIARVCIALAHLYVNQAPPMSEAALAAAERAAQLAVGNDRLLAAAGFRRGFALSYLGRQSEARDVLLRTIELADACGEMDALARSYNVLGSLEYESGNGDAARSHVEKAFDIAVRAGDLSMIAFYGSNLGTYAYRRGDWVEGRADYLRTLDLLRRMDAGPQLARPLIRLASASVDEGKREEALRLLAEAETLVEAPGLRRLIALTQARLAALEQRFDDAIPPLQRLLDDPELEKYDPYTALTVLAEAYLDRGDVDRASATVERALEYAGKLGGEARFIATPLRIRGRIHTARGAWDNACADFDAALEQLRLIRNPFEIAGVLRDYGVSQFSAGEMGLARAKLEEALAIYRQLGAGLWVERTERALMELG